jgi:hypothetical protein
MRLLFILLTFIPTLLSAQTDSWVRFAVQYDFYAPSESNFFMVEDTIQGDTVMFHQPTTPYETLDTIININSGDYVVTLSDSYGDGWVSQNPAWFKMMNDCQGPIINYDPLTMQFFTLDTLVNILPCAPPITGCMDSMALNYDPLATISGSCTYPACSGILSSNTYELCWNSQTAIVFEWESANNPNCDVIELHYGDENGYSITYPGYWPASNGWNNFAAAAGPGQMPPNWSLEHYMVLEYTDGSLSDTLFYTPAPCIPGCTDPTQPTYNPWATSDDGSCAGTTCDTTSQYQITMEITFDNWPSETSWLMNSAGVIGEAPVGTYDFNDIGQTYTYTFCVDQAAGFELVLNDTYGDGLAGSTSGGSLDGYVVIFDCNGDTIWELTDPAFGSVAYSGIQTGTACYIAPPVPGCMDDDYVEYNPLATVDDSSCSTLHVYGCTDSTSWNYDPNATINDIVPDCNYTLWIGDAAADGWGNSYIGVYQNGIDLGTFTMGPGQYEQTFPLILDAGVPVKVYYFEIGGPQTPPEEVQFQTWHNSFKLINADSVVLMHEGANPFANNGLGALQSFNSPFWTTYSGSPYCGDYCIEAVYGCMDSTAFNYNPLANTPDNCIPVVLGCTNPIAFNYDPNANVDDNSCVAEVIGCMDSTAFNFNPAANTNDPASCVPVILGCMDDTMFNYNPAANTSDNSCIPIIYGCTDPNSFNYDSNANTNNNSCVPFIYGCTDPNAFNYDPTANTDDSTCIDIVYGCMDPTMFNYDPLANVDNGVCEPFIYGCMDSTMFNFNPLANADNNSCIPFIYGCTDPSMLNYNPQANTEDFSCISYIYGCTDSTAINYDPLANTDNGTCIETVEGCTEVGAYNYDPTANVSDSSCLYDAGCITGPGNPYWLNDGCYAWVIDVDNYCCENAWDANCQSMYDYCQQGWPVGIEETGSGTTITVYPNPTDGILNIDTRLDISVEVYDINGKLMIEKNSKRINFSSWPTGIYNLIIRKDKLIISKRIIKQ